MTADLDTLYLPDRYATLDHIELGARVAMALWVENQRGDA